MRIKTSLFHLLCALGCVLLMTGCAINPVTGAGESAAAFNSHHMEIASSINSFRALSDTEQESVRALEIKTITAIKGLSYAALARESPLGVNGESYLRLLNGQYPEGEPVFGQIIKIVK